MACGEHIEVSGAPQKTSETEELQEKLQWSCALGCTHAANDSDDASDDENGDHNDAAVILPPEQLQLDADLKQEMEMDRELWNKWPRLSYCNLLRLWTFLCVIPVAVEAYRQRFRP